MIHQVKARNIFSYETLDLEFSEGLLNIDGFNYDDNCPEGSGKSSIGNILCWALFGKIPKDVKIDEVIREGSKGAITEVYLTSGYTICRSRKPNDLFIKTPENKTIRGKDAKETQLLIEKVVGFSFETFTQSIYFAQNDNNRFITANEADKAKVLSEILNLSQFDNARKATIELLKSAKSQVESLEQSLNMTKNSRDILVSQIEDTEVSISGVKENHKNQIDYAKSQVERTLASINSVKASDNNFDSSKIESDLENIDELLRSFIDNRSELLTELKSIEQNTKHKQRLELNLARLGKQYATAQEELEDLQNNKQTKKCPMCGNTTTNHVKHLDKLCADKAAILDSLILDQNETRHELQNIKISDSKQLKAKISDIDIKSSELQDIRRELRNKITQHEAKLLDKDRLEKDLKHSIDRVSQLELETPWKKLEENQEKNIKKVTALESELVSKNQVRQQALNHFNNLETLKKAFKDIKTYTFLGVLEELTTKSNEYLARLFETDVKIEFTASFEGKSPKIETTVSIDGNKRSLGLYSGGQARRIQLSVDLALSDLISARSDKQSNFRILDEAFKDLSEASMRKLLDLLQNFKGTTILIEHNTLFKAAFDKTIFVELRDGVSTLCQ